MTSYFLLQSSRAKIVAMNFYWADVGAVSKMCLYDVICYKSLYAYSVAFLIVIVVVKDINYNSIYIFNKLV